jgi:hypothetical protein
MITVMASKNGQYLCGGMLTPREVSRNLNLQYQDMTLLETMFRSVERTRTAWTEVLDNGTIIKVRVQ